MKDNFIDTHTRLDKLNPVFQNTLIGAVTSVVASIVLYFIIRQAQGGIAFSDITLLIIFAMIGPVIGYLTGIERKKLLKMQNDEQTLRLVFGKRENLFQKSRQQLQVLLDNASDAIVLTTKDGKILQFNSALTLISGYDAVELKHMTLKDFEIQNDSDKQGKTWLDNGIYRHEKVWKTKSGKNIRLEINSRFFNKGNKQFALHVARDIMHRSDNLIQEIHAQIYAIQHDKILESSKAQIHMIKRTQALMSGVMNLLKQHANDFSRDDEQLNIVLNDYKKLKNYIQLIFAKSQRDLSTDEALFNLNELLYQELTYCKSLYAESRLSIKTDFEKNLPELPYLGFDFSLAFGAVFHTLFEELCNQENAQIRISTETKHGNILISIISPLIQEFDRSLMKMLNPVGSEYEMNLASLIPQNLFNSLNARLSIDKSSTGLEITVRIPYKNIESNVEEESKEVISSHFDNMREEYPEVPDSHRKDDSTPAANDYVIL